MEISREKSSLFSIRPSGSGRAEAPASRDRRRTGRFAPRHPRPRLQRRIMTLTADPPSSNFSAINLDALLPAILPSSPSFAAAGGATPGGASLDIDDIAGETDQDRGEGRAPFPADNLPDGGSGGPARVVPGHSGRDWAAAIGNRDVRMKAERVKTPETTEEVSSHGVEKRAERHKWQQSAPCAREQSEKRACKPVGQEENCEKGPAGRGQETK